MCVYVFESLPIVARNVSIMFCVSEIVIWWEVVSVTNCIDIKLNYHVLIVVNMFLTLLLLSFLLGISQSDPYTSTRCLNSRATAT